LILDISSSGDSHHYRGGQRTPRRTGPNQATGSISPNGGLLTGRGVQSAIKSRSTRGFGGWP
jgi:hypothetical protein